MSLRTRVEALERALQQGDTSAETVVSVRMIVVSTRQEVEALRDAGVFQDSPGQPVPPGPVRVTFSGAVEARDLLEIVKSANCEEKV